MSARHLDPAAILIDNAKALADAKRREGADFLGPQMTFHRKPNPGGGPCDVCGCPGLRLGVEHRALEFGRAEPHAVYVKIKMDCTKDTVETYLDAYGRQGYARRLAYAS